MTTTTEYLRDLDAFASERDYRACRDLNWSLLKLIAKSPLHMHHGTRQRDRDEASESPALRLGRATHAAILEPERFAADWTVFHSARRGKVWQAFKEEHEGREILSSVEHHKATAMAEAVRARPELAALLSDGVAELSLRWTEIVPGHDEPLRMKARLDWVTEDADGGLLLVDVKTARDIDARVFGTQAARLVYHGQMAHYAAGLSKLTGQPVRTALLVVESEAPHDCGVYWLDDVALECGRRRRRELLAKLVESLQKEGAEGQIVGTRYLALPDWELAIFDRLED